VVDFQEAFRRGLGPLALDSQVHADQQTLAALEGVLNLLVKAERALDAATPEGRARAAVLLDRAEDHLDRRIPAESVGDDVRRHLDGVRALVRGHRARLESEPAGD